jgi:hypothetical protein
MQMLEMKSLCTLSAYQRKCSKGNRWVDLFNDADQLLMAHPLMKDALITQLIDITIDELILFQLYWSFKSSDVSSLTAL